MEVTGTYDSTVLDNADLFNDPFYKRFKLRPRELKLDENISKTYNFPTFYGDVTVMIGIFLCSRSKAKKMMLHPDIEPVVMTPGKSPVVFSCYIYNNVMGVAPYNEIAMTIPILVKPKINVPILPLLNDKAFKEFGYYVFSMPVTSKENMIRGHKLWGLPKVVQEIDIFEKDGDCFCTCKEESGEQYFEMRVPTTGTPTEFDVSSYLYSRLGDDFLQSETCFKANFNVNKYMKQLLVKNKPAKPFLKLGDTPSGRLLRDLEIEDQPIQTRFAKHMTACFDLPNEGFKPPIKF
ncbi:MAG TPA: acetoacetate decarboxylase family protein [bacterium]|nr:acetoacetate decarboxylase family protein [bacterium]